MVVLANYSNALERFGFHPHVIIGTRSPIPFHKIKGRLLVRMRIT